MQIKLSYECRDGQGRERVDGPVPAEKQRETADLRESIKCGVCGFSVTDKEQRIAIDGSHAHTFFNPAGIVFEVACFQKAAGCLLAGEPTSEFSWFAGHVWRYALCGSCKSHLGWFYEGRGTAFFGLIIKNLVW